MEYSQLLKLLKETRKNRNINQGEVAEYLNIDISAVSYYESGKRNITAELLEKWLRFFNLKYIVVEENVKDTIIIPSDEEIEAFQRLKDRRNEIIRNRQKEELNHLKKAFYENKGPFYENRGFIANHLMQGVGMVEEVILQAGSATRATIIYYQDIVINATFEEFRDFVAEPHLEPGEGVVEFEPFMESLRPHSLALSEKEWNSNGVIMYLDFFKSHKGAVIRDAKGFTPKLLVKIEENFMKYHNLLSSARRKLQESSFDFEELLMLSDKISKTVRKWQLNSNEQHPKFVEWSSSDLKATCYVESLTERRNKK